MKWLSRALFALLLLPILGHADVTVGSQDTGRCYPFMCNNSGTDIGQIIDYQQVYTATAFNGPLRVNSISWYYDSIDGGSAILLGGTYTLYWGYASFGSVSHLSTNLPSNYLSGSNLVGSFIIPSGGISDDPAMTFFLNSVEQFTYDPTLGNLLLEIVVTNQDNVPNGLGVGANGADDTGIVTSRAYCVTGSACRTGREGLVTTFGSSALVPEPGTLCLLGSAVIGLSGLLRSRPGR